MAQSLKRGTYEKKSERPEGALAKGVLGHVPPFRVSELPSPSFSAGNFQQIKTKENSAVVFSGAPLKTLFRLSRVLSDL